MLEGTIRKQTTAGERPLSWEEMYHNLEKENAKLREEIALVSKREVELDECLCNLEQTIKLLVKTYIK